MSDFLKNVLPPTREHHFRGSPWPQIAHKHVLFVRSPPGTLRKHAFSTFCSFSAHGWLSKCGFLFYGNWITPPLVGTISSQCCIQWLLEPQMVTNVPPGTPEIAVFSSILASRFGRVSNTGQHEHMQVNSMILHFGDALVADSIHTLIMPLHAIAYLLQMGGPSSKI